ncbi:hypothetical protein [Morganella morganii IS15]|nr:hypothetical protein CSB69_2995 [Morganella morganii]EMP52961.1 hypothetical protein C790_02937 [Morganella morganii SC01]CDK63561.1 hypothetical protein [Morganella morganii IS15]
MPPRLLSGFIKQISDVTLNLKQKNYPKTPFYVNTLFM